MVLYYIKWFDCNEESGDINKIEWFRKEADAITRMWAIKEESDSDQDIFPPERIGFIEFSGINQLVNRLNEINLIPK